MCGSSVTKRRALSSVLFTTEGTRLHCKAGLRWHRPSARDKDAPMFWISGTLDFGLNEVLEESAVPCCLLAYHR